jgi:hypothetical protein
MASRKIHPGNQAETSIYTVGENTASPCSKISTGDRNLKGKRKIRDS